MSSSDSGEASPDPNTPKYNRPKTRVSRACDLCRQRKVRCDKPGTAPGERCTNCRSFDRTCTFEMTVKKRGLRKGYVENLEKRLHSLEAILKQLYPNRDFSEELGPWTPRKRPRRTAVKTCSSVDAGPSRSKDRDSAEDDIPVSEDDEAPYNTLADRIERMRLHPTYVPYLGKSSAPGLIRKVHAAKREYSEQVGEIDSVQNTGSETRPEFLETHPWVAPLSDEPDPHRDFPSEDLMNELIRLYFKNINDYFPLLHRPTFEKRIADGLHLREEGFGSIVLLVCALGSKWSDEPRVLLPGEDHEQSHGWKYFHQVQAVEKSLLAPPHLYDLQICALIAFFLRCSNIPHWTIVGAGIRMAQDVGAHRRKAYGSVSTVESEHWKRAFWVLVAIDREMSMGLGRPCAIQDEDYDLELPVECDDDYWIISENGVNFEQPPDRPSQITYFNCFMRLNQILTIALRTIYSINKSRILQGRTDPAWKEEVVIKLDAALNDWIRSIPEHLRWNPERTDQRKALFLNQSAHLYASYSLVQILIHRQFIPPLCKSSPQSFPSHTICTNAARSTARVLSVPFLKYNSVLLFSLNPIVCSMVVLSLNVWEARKNGSPTGNNPEEMEHIGVLLAMLKQLEKRWFNAGRSWIHILNGMADAGTGQSPPTDSDLASSHQEDSDNEHNDVARLNPPHMSTVTRCSGKYATGMVPMTDSDNPVTEHRAKGVNEVFPPTSSATTTSASDPSSCLSNDRRSTSTSSINIAELGSTPTYPELDNYDYIAKQSCGGVHLSDEHVDSAKQYAPQLSYPIDPSDAPSQTWDQIMANLVPYLASPSSLLGGSGGEATSSLGETIPLGHDPPNFSIPFDYRPQGSSFSLYNPGFVRDRNGEWHLNHERS
ncbi:hypothetical protein K474DRAFT_1672279 [Panus rudis PR-1116 ss-1]|nr:hypothetical protein K474DRAFT_1672279 [Panus rudis PR-1116 ss-1]